jgi:nucleoporin GLE1
MYTVTTPDPDPQAKYNDKLPIMFIYLLNSLAKAAISQFAQEASSNPKAADPIGILVVKIFSLPGFHWRGKSLIDIVIAKFRVVLPVVFGIRGNDNTEEGRARVGWRRVDGQWTTEQDHQDRMVGLAAGYASISLRDFSNTKARLTNPYPPTHYWQAMATISSTPAQEQSVTQYIVLRAMTEFYEARFLTFYGDFAKAALKAALVEFPNRSTLSSTAAVSSLKVLADKLKRDMGLDLLLK